MFILRIILTHMIFELFGYTAKTMILFLKCRTVLWSVCMQNFYYDYYIIIMLAVVQTWNKIILGVFCYVSLSASEGIYLCIYSFGRHFNSKCTFLSSCACSACRIVPRCTIWALGMHRLPVFKITMFLFFNSCNVWESWMFLRFVAFTIFLYIVWLKF